MRKPWGDFRPSDRRLTTVNQTTTIRPRFEANQATSPSRMEHVHTGSGEPMRMGNARSPAAGKMTRANRDKGATP